jgi:hypothetical protein
MGFKRAQRTQKMIFIGVGCGGRITAAYRIQNIAMLLERLLQDAMAAFGTTRTCLHISRVSPIASSTTMHVECHAIGHRQDPRNRKWTKVSSVAKKAV